MDSLDDLTDNALTADRGPEKMNYTHQACIDLMIAHPELTQRAIAKRFGYTEAWLSTVICSDAFQAMLANPACRVHMPEAEKIAKPDVHLYDVVATAPDEPLAVSRCAAW